MLRWPARLGLSRPRVQRTSLGWSWLELQRLFGVRHPVPPIVTILEGPAGVEHRVHQAPVSGPPRIQTQLSAKNVESTAVDAGRHRFGIAEELTHVEAT